MRASPPTLAEGAHWPHARRLGVVPVSRPCRRLEEGTAPAAVAPGRRRRQPRPIRAADISARAVTSGMVGTKRGLVSPLWPRPEEFPSWETSGIATPQGRRARPFARPFRRQWATRGGMNGPNWVGNAVAGRGTRHPVTGGERDPTKLGARCADLGSSSPIGPPRDPSGARDHQRRDRPPPDSRSTAALPPGCPGQAAVEHCAPVSRRLVATADRSGHDGLLGCSAGPATASPYAHSYAHCGRRPWYSAGLAGGVAADEPHAPADRGRARQGAGARAPSFGPGALLARPHSSPRYSRWRRSGQSPLGKLR